MTKKIQESQPLEGEIVHVDKSMILSYESLALPILRKDQFEILTQPVPPHAIKMNQSFPYPASGWIKQVLLQAFGTDWDWKLLPIEGDKYYVLHERIEPNGTKPIQYVAVLGELTIRVRDAKLNIVATIIKTGIGSQTWRAKMEFGDCMKGAKTDALRNAAYDLGIAREMKWDDAAELSKYEEEQKAIYAAKQQEAEREAEQLKQPPTTLVELLTKAQRVYGMSANELGLRLGVGGINEIKDFGLAWAQLGSSNGTH